VTRDQLPEWGFEAEADTLPAPIVPVPAAQHAHLRGKRVIVGIPGLGWRGDLRADSSVVHGSRTFVPVLAEHEWYRSEAEQIEVFAPLVPVHRVWVETVSRRDDPMMPLDDEPGLVSLDAPPARRPVPIRDGGRVTGRRLVRMDGDDAPAEERNLRAVTEMHVNSRGILCVRVAREMDWYRWSWSGRPPHTLEVPSRCLWLE
jgi:hypothetical protein